MRALVVGYGSIGSRHARLLTELGCSTAVVSAREVDFETVFPDLAAALQAGPADYVVVANATDRHHDTLEWLARKDFRGSLLIEKPLFDRYRPLPEHRFRFAGVAYNLRFHPVVQRLKSLLEGQKVLSVQAYAGQYLPHWRPDSDYRDSYSADAQRGGGVLRDLSHELDYLLWMLGGWSAVSALGGKLSSLEISSDDVCALLLSTPLCPVVSIQLNYLDRRARRCVIVNTDDHTIEADLIEGTVKVDKVVESFVNERDATYRAMHESVLGGRAGIVCSLPEAHETLRLIEAARQAMERQQWVRR